MAVEADNWTNNRRYLPSHCPAPRPGDEGASDGDGDTSPDEDLADNTADTSTADAASAGGGWGSFGALASSADRAQWSPRASANSDDQLNADNDSPRCVRAKARRLSRRWRALDLRAFGGPETDEEDVEEAVFARGGLEDDISSDDEPTDDDGGAGGDLTRAAPNPALPSPATAPASLPSMDGAAVDEDDGTAAAPTVVAAPPAATATATRVRRTSSAARHASVAFLSRPINNHRDDGGSDDELDSASAAQRTRMLAARASAEAREKRAEEERSRLGAAATTEAAAAFDLATEAAAASTNATANALEASGTPPSSFLASPRGGRRTRTSVRFADDAIAVDDLRPASAVEDDVPRPSRSPRSPRNTWRDKWVM